MSEDSVIRGLEFVKEFSDRRCILEKYGHDVLFLFLHVATTSRNPSTRRFALSAGQHLAKRWRQFQRISYQSNTLIERLIAEQAAHDLGVVDISFRRKIRGSIRHDHILDAIGFDPHIEPPPSDIPHCCYRCDCENNRGRKACYYCKGRLDLRSTYSTLTDALIISHHFSSYGPISENLHFDVLKWIHTLRPYPPVRRYRTIVLEAAYAVTHIVWTLNNYNEIQLPPRLLQPEYHYLREVLPLAMARQDFDLVGECIDSLNAFGLSKNGRILKPSIQFLQNNQNTDGSWSSMDDEDHYRIHSTWSAIDGIREHHWSRSRLKTNNYFDGVRQINS